MLEKLTTMLCYLTAALIVAIVAIGMFVRYKHPQKLNMFLASTLGTVAGYSVAAGGTLLYLTMLELKEDGGFSPNLFYPLLGLLILTLTLTAIGFFIAKYKKEWLKPYSGISFAIALIYIILLVTLNALKAYMYETFTVADNVLLILFSVIFAVILVALPLVFGKKIKDEYNTRAVVYGALCIALSFSLSYLKLFELPQGGSVTFASLLPLMLYSYMFGIRKGVLSAFIYGILQAIQDPYILHPVQFLLDYPLAFGMIGLAGIFKELNLFKGNALLQLILGGISASVLRYACHLVSGIIVFDIYSQLPSPIAWSFLYNAFVFVDITIALVAGASMMSSKSFRNLVELK